MSTEILNLFPKQTLLKKNKQVRVLPVLRKQYELSFQVYPTSFLSGKWVSVLHLTTSGNNDIYGARIPGIWFSPKAANNKNTIYTANAISGK